MFSLFRRWSRQTNQTDLSRPTESVALYNTYDARSALSQLLKRARAGERIVIARAGEPVAMLVPYDVPVETRPGVFRMSLLVHDAPRDVEEVIPTQSSPEAST
jgi:prevent-host-death family protein